jgi:hypothetical protein
VPPPATRYNGSVVQRQHYDGWVFEVELTNEVRDRYLALSVKDQQAIGGAIDLLAERDQRSDA